MLRTSSFVFGAFALTAVACGGDESLTLNGTAHVTVDGTVMGFDFPTDTHVGGSTTASCRVRRLAAGQYSVVLDLNQHPSGTRPGLESLTVMGRSDSTASGIASRINNVDFASATLCVVEVSATEGGDAQLDTTGCALSADTGAIASADVHLELHNCSVE
jgi:hypothetical protein